jgi:hypothetical protein
MKVRLLTTALVFLSAAAAGWVTVPSQAECRMCASKTCSSDNSCGKCTCVWPNGKTYKRGICVAIGD